MAVRLRREFDQPEIVHCDQVSLKFNISEDMAQTADEPVVVLGAGPAGMATALGLIKAGFRVNLYERYDEA
jgi:NADPH-dependent 2,4-dienoyl-CoA reductase/sulfur reductase-like enzyme